VGSDPQHILDETTIRTTTPEETIAQVVEFFREIRKRVELTAIGIGSFGPIDLNRRSPTFGYITNTPKTGWSNTDFIGRIGRELNVPLVFDTDTNAAALGEATWGSARGFETILYITIGTGIGGGLLVKGTPLHGLCHPEVGHMRVPHDWKDDPFPGACPFHGDCLEGLASGPSLLKRWGVSGEALPSNHRAWSLESNYVAAGLTNLIFAISPERIVLGRGVMERTELFVTIRSNVQELIHGYFDHMLLQDKIAEYIVPPKLGKRSGVLGAIALAKRAIDHTI
jgi:fructokinase